MTYRISLVSQTSVDSFSISSRISWRPAALNQTWPHHHQCYQHYPPKSPLMPLPWLCFTPPVIYLALVACIQNAYVQLIPGAMAMARMTAYLSTQTQLSPVCVDSISHALGSSSRLSMNKQSILVPLSNGSLGSETVQMKIQACGLSSRRFSRMVCLTHQ